MSWAGELGLSSPKRRLAGEDPMRQNSGSQGRMWPGRSPKSGLQLQGPLGEEE